MIEKNKLIALAEKCSAEVGRHEGQVVWVKFHSLSSVECFSARITMRAAVERYQDAARYRWLRANRAHEVFAHVPNHTPWIDVEPALDAAIDAAIARALPQVGEKHV